MAPEFLFPLMVFLFSRFLFLSCSGHGFLVSKANDTYDPHNDILVLFYELNLSGFILANITKKCLAIFYF